MSLITFDCPNCSKSILDIDAETQFFNCPHCGLRIMLPQHAGSSKRFKLTDGVQGIEPVSEPSGKRVPPARENSDGAKPRLTLHKRVDEPRPSGPSPTGPEPKESPIPGAHPCGKKRFTIRKEPGATGGGTAT